MISGTRDNDDIFGGVFFDNLVVVIALFLNSSKMSIDHKISVVRTRISAIFQCNIIVISQAY